MNIIYEIEELIEDVVDSAKAIIEKRRIRSDRTKHIRINNIKRNRVAVYNGELVGIAKIYPNKMVLIDDVFWLKVAVYGFPWVFYSGAFKFQNLRTVDPRSLTRCKRVF